MPDYRDSFDHELLLEALKKKEDEKTEPRDNQFHVKIR